MNTEFILTDDSKVAVLGRLAKIAEKGKWRLSVEPYKPRRSDNQNRYLWGVVYPTIIEKAQLEGWDKDDLHEFFLIDHFGSEVIEGFGRKRHKPLKRSAKLSTTEFMDYIAHIQRFAAERGIVIPDPEGEFE